MSKPAGHIEAQLRALAKRVAELERGERNQSAITGNLISSTDGLAKCVKTMQDTQQTLIDTQHTSAATLNGLIAQGNATASAVNDMGAAVAWLMSTHSDEDVSVH
jgi:hypothetical protein